MLLKLVSDASDSSTLTLALRLLVLVTHQASADLDGVLVLQLLAVILTRKAASLDADSVACVLALAAPDGCMRDEHAVRELLLNFAIWRAAPVAIAASLIEQLRALLSPACPARARNVALLVRAHALQHALDALREDCPDAAVAAKLGLLVETLAGDAPGDEMAACFERFLLSTFDRTFSRSGPSSSSNSGGGIRRDGPAARPDVLTSARVIALRALVSVSRQAKVRAKI